MALLLVWVWVLTYLLVLVLVLVLSCLTPPQYSAQISELKARVPPQDLQSPR